MYRSVELRWFFRIEPVSAGIFFAESPEARTRTDWYAFPCDERSGIKIREGNYEVKLRTRNLRDFTPDTQSGQCIATGRLEEWQKWSVSFPSRDIPSGDILAGAGWVPATKARRMRLFSVQNGSLYDVSRDTAGRIENGCQVEYTELSVKEQKWWTLGLEAFGRPGSIENNLRIAANHFFATLIREVEGRLHGFELKNSYGYPAWLQVVDSQ